MIKQLNEELPKINPRFAQNEGIKLGLTREQVSTYNFGFHTIDAIRKDVEEGANLQKAFEKYSKLNNP